MRAALSVVFAGSGGSGAMTAGTLLLRSVARAGYYGLMTQLFGAQVRGGESAALVQVSTGPVECQPGQGRAVRSGNFARCGKHHRCRPRKRRRSGGYLPIKGARRSLPDERSRRGAGKIVARRSERAEQSDVNIAIHGAHGDAPGGIGLRPFNPLSLAIAAGANFVARGFSGDPNGLAEMIVEGIRWPGFALIEVLSPRITFRPEQVEWKQKVRRGAPAVSDRAAAVAAVLADDGFSLGIRFKGERAPIAQPAPPLTSLAQIESQFSVGRPDPNAEQNHA
jgi:hypothetical protein